MELFARYSKARLHAKGVVSSYSRFGHDPRRKVKRDQCLILPASFTKFQKTVNDILS